MGRWISADYIKAVMKGDRLLQGNCEYELWKQEVDRQVNAMPCIDLADYVPKDFHDKTCEAMAKAHQEEIADIVRVVRCKECRKCYKVMDALTEQTVLICQKHKYEFDWEKVEADDFCSYGERRGVSDDGSA